MVVNPRITPLKGEPDFTKTSDEKLVEYRNLIQDMIFTYKYCDKKVVDVLQKVHKQISDNLTERLAYDTMTVLDRQIERNKDSEDLVKKPFHKPFKIKVIKSI